MPDQSGPRLTMNASSGVGQQVTGETCTTAGQRQREGGRHIRKQQESRKGRMVEIKVGTLNIGTKTCKGRELADMM